MRTKLLELTLSNVIERRRSKPLQEITFMDLLLPMRDIQEADRVTVTDGVNVKVLKERRVTAETVMFYPVEPNKQD